MDKCTGHNDITEIMLKIVLNAIQSISHFSLLLPLKCPLCINLPFPLCRLSQYSFLGLMVFIVIAFIPLSLLTAVYCFDSGYVRKQPIERVLCRVQVKRTPGKHG